MINTKTNFYGRQTDERILFMIQSHPIALVLNLLKIYSAALIVLLAFVLIGHQLRGLDGTFTFLGFLFTAIIIVGGSWILKVAYQKNKTYLTDRRIIRFEPTTIFATNMRSLTWDEVVKVKTYPQNFLLKQMKIGNVVVHARTTVRTANDEISNSVTVDDIEMKHVYYYRDLGNYIDKILFTYKKMPKEMVEIKPFIPKPKGQRD